MNSDIKFYLSLLMRRLPILLVIFVTFSVIGGALALFLPSQYRASAVLLVESAQIPDELASSTVRTPSLEQLEIIEQRLIRRANLIDIANEFQVFEGGPRMNPDEVVSEMRARTGISRSVGRNRATLMTISFEGDDPRIAAGVVNQLTSLVLNEDSERRQALAEQTLDFFEQEVDRLERALSQRSADIVSFKETNFNTLPEKLDFKLDRQTRILDQQSRLEEEVSRLRTQRNRLVELGTSALSGGAQQGQLSQAARELQAAESELEQARLLYSAQNPRIRVLEGRVAALETRVAAERGGESETVDTAQAILELQLTEIDERARSIALELDRSSTELAELEEAIDRTPETASRLEALERDYQNTQSQYNAAINNLAKAQTGERIEVLAKGQRITVIEQAVPPTEPTSPNRPLIAGGGVLLGTGLAAAFFLLGELLNRAIRRPSELVSGLGVQPLATIPYLETTGGKRRRRALSTLGILAIAIGIPVALWFLHYNFMPLDLVFDKIIDRIGL